MGMDIGARVKVTENHYGFAPESHFTNIDFMEGTDMRCDQFIRRALAYAGIDFSQIDGFIILPQENVPQIVKQVKQFQKIYNMPDFYNDVISSLIKFMGICIQNNFYIIIG